MPATIADPLEAAKIELARRELCRREYRHYYQSSYPQYHFGWMHRKICGELQTFSEAVERRESPRLQICVPPQHGKSHNASRAFVAWLLGKHPDWPIIAAAYAVNLSAGHSRWVRNRLKSPKHAEIFPAAGCRLSPDSQAVDQFSLVGGGQLKAVGADGGVSGNPARVLIADDLFAGREEADSQTIREKRWEWYQTDFRTRLAEGGGILIINTRWHEDDISGKTLAAEKAGIAAGDENADRWEVLKFPAIAEEDEEFRKQGEPLFPEVKSLKTLLSAKSELTPRNWQSVYQQNPYDVQGSYFKAEHFRTYTGQHPKYCNNYVTVDLALGKNQINDWTVILPAAIDPNDDMYILPRVIRKRMDPLETACRLMSLATDLDAEIVTLPSDQMGKSLFPFLEKFMDHGAENEKAGGELFTFPKANFSIHWMSVVEDKQARGRSAQGWQERGKVYWPDNAQFTDIIKPEMLKFPTGKHDDVVDAFADMGRLLRELQKGRKPKEEEQDHPDLKRWKEIANRVRPVQDHSQYQLFGRDKP